MLKKFFILLIITISLSFTSCGSGSSKEARELLSKILQFVGIPHNIIVNVCQDENRDGICGAKEIFTKVTINKGESVSDILKKIALRPDGKYFLETYDPDIPLLVELQDPENIKHDNSTFTLKFNGFENNEQNEIKEISAIQSIEDAGYLTAEETQALKALDNREVVDRVIFESLENNYNLLRDKSLSSQVSVEKGLESVALGLQSLSIEKELPAKLATCANDNNCIKEIVTSTSQELNITKEEAEVIADEVKKDKQSKAQKNIADGYIAHLTSPIEAKCSDGSHFTTTVGLKGSILFDRELDDSCEIIVPSSAIIDSNNNGVYDKNSDKAVGFTMRGLADGTFITPLTTLLLEKQAKGEDVTTFKAMVKDFNPVSSASAVGLYRGEKRNRVQKLMLLMEILKTAMKEGVDVSSIDLTQIISNISLKDINLNSLLGGISNSFKSKIIDSLERSGFKTLITQLDKFDTSKVNLNTLMVNISDGKSSLDSSIIESSLISIKDRSRPIYEVVKEGVDVEGIFGDLASVFVVTPTPTPTLPPIVTPTPTPTIMLTPRPTPTPAPTKSSLIATNKLIEIYNKWGDNELVYWGVEPVVPFAKDLGDVYSIATNTYLDISAFEKVSGIKYEVDGLTDTECKNYTERCYSNSYKNKNFLHINPKMIKWVLDNLLVPTPAYSEIQSFYDAKGKEFLTPFVYAYKYLNEKRSFSKEVDAYKEGINQNRDMTKYLKDRYSDDISSSSYDRFDTYIGFWLRRGVDGSDRAVLDALKRILKAYDSELLRVL